ncbi:WD40-repeat-containing domain protein [Lipomyces arxii]|uniref:WD40-repeat-containing domain protein n=1 Tax=Lipomyces arxii TaxID=56418 RepID=UPI0034CD3D5C
MTIENGVSTSRQTTTFVDTASFVSHPARVTIKHWQLRDLICNTTNSHEVLYVSERSVRSMDTESGKTTLVSEFAFEPRCLASAYGFVAVGGVQRGQLGITHRRSESDFEEEAQSSISVFELGGYINNSITLFSPGASSVLALICNNDHTLRMLDLSDSSYTILDSLQLPVPLNHASISPDHKTVIACGDSAQLFMFHPEEPHGAAYESMVGTRVDGPVAMKWKHQATLSTSADAGFSTAFTPSGVLFAVASQDGLASIYDSRYLSTSTHMSLPSFHSAYTSNRNMPKPLKYIESTRPHEGAGAFRCLKFSTGAEDLLLITEQAGRVHVVDARRLEDRQILDIPHASCRRRMLRRRRDNPTLSSSLPGASDDPFRRRRAMGHASTRLYADSSFYTEDGPVYRYGSYEGRRHSIASDRGDTLDQELEDAEGEYGEDEDDDRYCIYESVSSPSARTSSLLAAAAAGSSSITGRYSHSLDPNRRLMREKEISGIAWSEEDGGSIIVGWDSGIGKWSLDRWGRRVFPSYNMR